MSVELRRLMVGSQAIDYVITRRERKTLEIAVEPDASVSVAAPLDASIDAIEIAPPPTGGKMRRSACGGIGMSRPAR